MPDVTKSNQKDSNVTLNEWSVCKLKKNTFSFTTIFQIDLHVWTLSGILPYMFF